MKIIFNINFYTVWGQSLYITGSIPSLGEWSTAGAIPMEYTGDGNWKLELEIPDEKLSFEYRYFMKSNDKLIFEEWNKNHSLRINDTEKSYYLVDYWQNHPQNLAYYSSAFIKSLFAHPCDKFERVVKSDRKILIKVLAPHIEKDQSLAITGNQEQLGNWNSHDAIILGCDNFPEWFVELDARKLTFPLEYKFLIINNNDRTVAGWEYGENRKLTIPENRNNEITVVSGLQFKDVFPTFKCAGLVIPVFSLRSRESFGIGDFADLKKIIDWAKQTGQKIIQVLPVNDTTTTHTWLDSYPYNAISIYALHPLYLSLSKMGEIKEKEKAAFYKARQEELNQADHVDYMAVDKYKWSFFRDIFEQDGDMTLASEDFDRFFSLNQSWLVPYAAFCYLRDIYKIPDFKLWKEYAEYNREKIEILCAPGTAHYKEITFYYFLQYHLDKQLTEVKEHAWLNGIVLKGDIPIGISSTSVEAWTEPQYFNISEHAGAPPDDFSVTGQNWKFPTYNWEEMEKDNYAWWKKRFRKMSDYFDAYRIDHILGFFRIWEIPEQYVQGLCGTFNPALPLSIHEIEEAGLAFKKELFTRPHINKDFLEEIFGEYISEVISTFLQPYDQQYFVLKELFNTQLKIQAYFANKTDEKSNRIQDGLFKITNEVLFIPDKKQQDTYHPRISAMNTYVYKELSNADKYAFDQIYWDFFYYRHNNFWKENGYKHLTPLISCTDMLVCGEDLGMIPQSVPEVMHKLQILSLEIERMPKESNVEFTNLATIPYHSVCTTSTHDMTVIRNWWKEDRQKTQRYYNQVLQHQGEAPQECNAKLCEQIITNHLNSPAMFVIIPFQDWLSIDDKLKNPDPVAERVNIPSNPRYHWKYRMHLTIEELMEECEFNAKIKTLIEQSNR